MRRCGSSTGPFEPQGKLKTGRYTGRGDPEASPYRVNRDAL